MKIRSKIESFFDIWSEFAVSHRWWVLIITLSLTLATLPQIRNGWLDVSTESFLPKHDPAIVDYYQFREDFNFTPSSTLTIETKDTIFTLENLAKLKAVHDAIEDRVPNIDDIVSLVSIRHTRGENDSLLADDLIELWPQTEEEMPAFRELVMSNPNYVGGVISYNSQFTSIAIQPNLYTSVGSDSGDDLMDGFDDEDSSNGEEIKLDYLSPDEETAFADAIFKIQEEFSSDDFKIYVAGGANMNLKLSRDMEDSTKIGTQIGMLLILLLLTILFRRVSGVVLPIIIVILSLLVTLALWPAMGYAYNGNIRIIPTFILAVGIADAVHILSIFYKLYDNGQSKHDAIINAMKQTSIAVLMTTITTAAGLLSFLASDMIPTKTLGIFGAIGVVMAFIFTLTVIPTLLAIFPIKRKQKNGEETSGKMLGAIDHFIESCGEFGINHAKTIVATSAALSVVALIGISFVTFKHNPIRWYPEGAELPRTIDLIDEHFDGSMTMQVLLDTQKENALYEPSVLRALEELENTIEEYQYNDLDAREAISILSVVKETHKALNSNNDDFFVIPDERETVAQELLLFENSGVDDIDDFTDTTFRHARINTQMKWGDVLNYSHYIDTLHEKIDQILIKHKMEDAEVSIVGLLPIFGKAINALLWGTMQSYLLAFIFVGLLMYMLMGNLRNGLLAFSPNILPILFIVGIMGWLNIPLNMMTSTIGCIIIGISVDDTIHFMHHFRRYANKSDDIHLVIHNTLHTCGRAITFTSIVLIGGFIVNALGEFVTSKQFAYLTSLAILFALIANLVLAPALMSLFWKGNTEEKT